MKTKFVWLVTLMLIVTLFAGACAAPTPQTIIQTVEVEKQVVVTQEVVKEVQVTKEVQVEVVKTVEVPAEPKTTPLEENPYYPAKLIEMVGKIQEATAGKAPPDGAKYALLTNAVAPFWTAAQIGASRSSAEIGVPIVFQAPTAADKLSQQLSMLETFVNDGYNAITFSAIDRDAATPIVNDAIDKGISVLCTDSDATGSNRYLYIGMSDYDAGFAAGKAALEIVGKGKMVGLVGYATAQNAQDRIAGFKDAIAGTELTLEEVLLDDVKPELALSNAQTAMQKYPDLAGFITLYSYDGPAACQAVKQADQIGKVKIIAFDAEPETQRCMEDGAVQVMIGQRVYFYGYLSGYIMNLFTILGKDEAMKLLDPYLDGDPKYRVNTGVDVIKADTFDLYKEYLNAIGIPSQ
jgi:ribose transport system substrate-binding protein